MSAQIRDTNVYCLYDGGLIVWNSGRNKEMPFEVDVINGGIKQLLITQNAFVIISTDNSMRSYKFQIQDNTIDNESFFKMESDSQTITITSESYDIEILDKILYKLYVEHNKSKIQSQNKDLIVGIQEIKDKLDTLYEENKKNPDIRKLDKEEFLINTEFREVLENETKNKITEIRYKSKINNLLKEAERFLILKYTKDNMENEYRGLCAIRQSLTIYNYVIPKLSDNIKTKMTKAKYRVMLDLRSKVWRNTYGKKRIDFKDFKINYNENYIVNLNPGENKIIELLLSDEKQVKKEYEFIVPCKPFEAQMMNNISEF